VLQVFDDAYPEPRLYPIRPNDWARALWYEDLAGGRISELAAGIFFQRFIGPLAFKLEPDEELITRIIEKDLPPMLDYLESQIPMGRFIFDDFMMADLSITSPFINAAYAGYQVDESRWPNLAGLVARVRAQPQVMAVLEKEKRVLGLD
jgi:glutathione S-transferase